MIPLRTMRKTAIDILFSVPFLLTVPTAAAACVGLVIAWAMHTAESPNVARTVFWIAMIPSLYFLWLVLFLGLCSLNVQTRRWNPGLRKQPRVSTADGGFRFYPAMTLYLRKRFVYSLPLVEALLTISGLRQLVLHSYSTETHVGEGCWILGDIFDPDLTILGNDCVIGAGSSLVAHSITVDPSGHLTLVTAPISIGPRVVVGGDSKIDLGVRIEEDSLIEPHSYVPAYTQIGAAEVWGGNPARFIRKRFHAAPEPNRRAAAVAAPAVTVGKPDIENQVREIVASALHRSVESIPADFSVKDCAGWDSLAQLGMSVEIQRRFGIRLTHQESFQLRSLQSIRDLLHRS